MLLSNHCLKVYLFGIDSSVMLSCNLVQEKTGTNEEQPDILMEMNECEVHYAFPPISFNGLFGQHSNGPPNP